MSPWPFHRRHRPDGGHVVVRLGGDIDKGNAEGTAQHLLAALSVHPDVLEADLRDVRHLSADGCLAFFTVLRTLRSTPTRLIVTHAGPQVRAMLFQVGLVRALRGAHNLSEEP
ncbi:STAS domain-containing protein [Streptomyces sp. NBC_01304]|uniref:STAS domain-containing protein n=1 Tax=Streptomyces sp. NBC_01304 TaxID=2903818 RepID=UPI002E15731A|nr:STAS domain-containing protein [Streptomyces sp. NBC_01304]